MHILILTSWYKTKEDYIGAQFIEDQARSLMKMNHKVAILATLWKRNFRDVIFGQKTEKEPKPFDDFGLMTYYTFLGSNLPLPRALQYKINQKTILNAFDDYVKLNGKPDLIHAHVALLAGIGAQLISEQRNIPFVLTEHFSGINMKQSTVDRKFQFEAYQTARRVICVSHFLKSIFINKNFATLKQVSVIPNIVNPVFFHQQSKITDQSVFSICWIGGLNENKNPFMAIRSVEHLLLRKVNCKLTIVGEGPLLQSLKTYVISKNLSTHVIFTGWLNILELTEKIKHFDMLISTSFIETFGVSIAEALAMGKPVVVTDSGGPSDFVNQNNGLIIKNANPESFAHGILEVLNNYSRYSPDLISAECKNKFSELVIGQQLINLYEECLQ